MTIRAMILLAAILALFTSAGHAQQNNQNCPRPAALLPEAFNQPMNFVWASNKGNMSTSDWVAAVGVITRETPARFAAFVEKTGVSGGQIVLHSPGGNLSAGLEIGRMMRKLGMTAHIGRTERTFHSDYRTSCDRWGDMVESGVCASACAYAFLGGQVRFVDSPYYPTSGNRLGFHQFYGSQNRGGEMLSSEEVAEIEATTLSVAQALTGQIVLYAMEMGVDARIVALAAKTPSDDLYYPTPKETESLSIVSGKGLSEWFMEPYASGLVTAARPARSDSMLEQVTAFCSASNGQPILMFTMALVTPSFPDPATLPLDAIEITLDGATHSVPRRFLDVRYWDGKIVVNAPVNHLQSQILAARQIEFRLDGARVMGGFLEGNSMDEEARRSLALAWRNCI